MMTVTKRTALVAASLLSLAGAPPAFAASLVTRTFLANVVPNVDFLDRSSRLVLENSKTARLRDFARGQAREQTLAANALDEWMEADAKPEVALAGSADLDRTATGSTKAASRPAPSQIDTKDVVDDRLPMGQEDLDSLEGLEGREFDDLYKEKQRDALRQVETDYKDYIGAGDVPALKTLAKRELPKVKRRLLQLGRL